MSACVRDDQLFLPPDRPKAYNRLKIARKQEKIKPRAIYRLLDLAAGKETNIRATAIKRRKRWFSVARVNVCLYGVKKPDRQMVKKYKKCRSGRSCRSLLNAVTSLLITSSNRRTNDRPAKKNKKRTNNWSIGSSNELVEEGWVSFSSSNMR